MLEYKEPHIPELLTLVSFLVLLNALRIIVDRLFYVGLLAEIILGCIYGSPITGIVPGDWEHTFLVIGYVGLLLIVFEGGMEVDASALLRSLSMSTICALFGIILPICLSLLLLHASFGYELLESFLAGAALSSTSLGTTFFVMKAVPTHKTLSIQLDGRNAPNLQVSEHSSSSDDMLSPDQQHRQALEDESAGSLVKSRIGAVLVAAALIDDIIALILLSIVSSLGARSSSNLTTSIIKPLVSSICLTIFFPVVTHYLLKPAFANLASRHLVRWERDHQHALAFTLIVIAIAALVTIAHYIGTSMLLGAFMAGFIIQQLQPASEAVGSFRQAYKHYLGQVQEFILAPLFFASIGFAIPFLDLWKGAYIWRGIVYTILMIIGKFGVGMFVFIWDAFESRGRRSPRQGNAVQDGERASHNRESACLPAAFLGFAMVARGEIGIIIAQIAHASNTDETRLMSEDVFVVSVWAIFLCTLIGPLAVGFLLTRKGKALLESRWGLQL